MRLAAQQQSAQQQSGNKSELAELQNLACVKIGKIHNEQIISHVGAQPSPGVVRPPPKYEVRCHPPRHA